MTTFKVENVEYILTCDEQTLTIDIHDNLNNQTYRQVFHSNDMIFKDRAIITSPQSLYEFLIIGFQNDEECETVDIDISAYHDEFIMKVTVHVHDNYEEVMPFSVPLYCAPKFDSIETEAVAFQPITEIEALRQRVEALETQCEELNKFKYLFTSYMSELQSKLEHFGLVWKGERNNE